MKTPDDNKKGFFSHLRLPVSENYVVPGARKAMFFAGGLGGIVILFVVTFNVALQRGTLISNGPLSSNHALFGEDCASCHTPFDDVADDKCAVCHEKYGDEVGIHTFASHYLYRSGDFTRVVPSPDEVSCATCHTEHIGRAAPIAEVADAQCLSCHGYESFNKRHPDFHFAVEDIVDPANLKFPHALHVREVKSYEELADIEQTCLYCHQPDPDGRNFQPLDFDRQCDACHLTVSTGTPWLPVSEGALTEVPAVLPLETIRAQQAPGTRWANYMNPNEFQYRGESVRKRPLYHEDPWILENLRRLRGVLYPTQGLADLLRASGDVDPEDARVLYEEAITTLRDYAEALRARPEREVQDELAAINRLLALVEERLRDPYSPLDETRFAIGAAELNPALPPEQVNAYRLFVDELTAPCQQCHLVENATLMRVQAEQEALARAEFNHGAHIIHRRCLQCHTAIPIQQLAATETAIDSTRDHAGIQNLPTVDVCQDCHDTGKASNTCITCHLFHPDKSQRSNLLLYLKEE